MRKITLLSILLCSGIHFTQAQLAQWTPGVESLSTDAHVGIGTTNFSARLHIADGFGGEQLRISRGTGSVRFTQGLDKDNLYLWNSDATKLYMIWQDNGNVGIGTNAPSEKLTVTGNLLLTGAPKIQFGNRAMMQVPIALENSYTRSIISQNIVWNESTSKWSIPDQMYTDFSMLRFENNGRISFFNRTMSSGAEMTDSEMEAYRRLTIIENGHVGIGTSSPADLLTVNAGSTRRGITITSDGDADAFSDFQFNITNTSSIQAGRATHWVVSHRKDGFFSGAPSGQSSLEFFSNIAGGGYYAPLCFNYNGDIIMASSKNAVAGNVLIGKTSQTNTSYKLDINGNVRANKIVVNTTGADFVFEEDYKLRKLDELQKYIQQHKHLPEIQPAKEMVTEGLDVGEMNIKLLQKIEELTLYLIEQNKRMEKLEADNEQLKREIKLKNQ